MSRWNAAAHVEYGSGRIAPTLSSALHAKKPWARQLARCRRITIKKLQYFQFGA
jgi:hypothetical protein